MSMRGGLSLLGLKIDMMLTLSFIIAVSGFVFVFLLGSSIGLVGGLALALAFNFLMWLISPYLLTTMYRLKPVERENLPWLYSTIEMLAMKSGLKKMPKVYIAPTQVPNAFAFGSPFFGYGVAVTEGLLHTLNEDEIEAVLGHEIGHIKHGDMHVMMIATSLPAIFLYIGRWLIWGSMLGYSSRDRDESGYTYIIGISLVVIGWLLYLLALHLSRLREFYADAHSATTVEGGAEKLQRALVKIVENTDPKQGAKLASAKALMISDPTQREIAEENIRSIMEREVSFSERIMSLFSTHPRIEERLKRLEKFKGISG